MKDIAYSNGHLILKDGDFQLVEGKDRVIQHLFTGLKILKGDWFLDYRKGIDYFNNLKAFPKLLKAEIKDAIKEVYGVQSVRDYKFKQVGDKYQVSATVLVDNQEYYINEEYRL